VKPKNKKAIKKQKVIKPYPISNCPPMLLKPNPVKYGCKEYFYDDHINCIYLNDPC